MEMVALTLDLILMYSSSRGASSDPEEVIEAFPWDVLAAALAEETIHLDATTKDGAGGATKNGTNGAAKIEAGGARANRAGAWDEVDAIEDDGAKITITSHHRQQQGPFLGHDAGGLIDANGPPKDGPAWGFFTMAFFSFSVTPSAATLFQVVPFNTSCNTFIPAKEAE